MRPRGSPYKAGPTRYRSRRSFLPTPRQLSFDLIPVKALRHTAKTLHPRAGIAPEHSAQLLGHEAQSLGERVYLHRHGPSLAEAATKYETFVRRLLGDFER